MRYARRFIVGIVIFGIFYLVFHYIFAAAKTYINLLLAGFFTIVLPKLWQWRREVKKFKKVRAEVLEEKEKEKHIPPLPDQNHPGKIPLDYIDGL